MNQSVYTIRSLYKLLTVPGGVETRYSCCEGVMGAPGCQVFKVGKDSETLFRTTG